MQYGSCVESAKSQLDRKSPQQRGPPLWKNERPGGTKLSKLNEIAWEKVAQSVQHNVH